MRPQISPFRYCRGNTPLGKSGCVKFSGVLIREDPFVREPRMDGTAADSASQSPVFFTSYGYFRPPKMQSSLLPNLNVDFQSGNSPDSGRSTVGDAVD